MPSIVDLHTHSTFSDGQHTPSELVQLGAESKLQIMALTDHDTTEGLDEAVRAGEKYGVRILRGVELAAKEHRHMHILGYCFSSAPSRLTQLCAKLREGRNERKYRIIDFLREKGVNISLDEVEETAGGTVIARPHFAQVMLRRGYVKTIQEAFSKYLDTDEYQRIERFKASAQECIETIHDAGGKASLAHPYQLFFDDVKLDGTVRKLSGWGLDAMECFYPKHTEKQREFYISLAGKYSLHITGGSDFHGKNVKPDVVLTPIPLELEWLLN